ncbi:hypothetical protein ACMA1D_20365 [Streptomyces sp. 796.1]|uniref:hypothetical protein n=1 Tax=Streptomyces sp. 796.1 TaxID=3163029 RepID=UPI0039C9A460
MGTPAPSGTAPASATHAQALDVMMQDVLQAVGVPVDAASARPIAPFYARSTVAAGDAPQAIVITSAAGLPRSALHVVRDQRAPLGWRVVPLDLGAGVEPAEVVVVRHPLRCVVLDAAGALHTCAFDPERGGFGPARRLAADDGTRWEALRSDGGGLAYARARARDGADAPPGARAQDGADAQHEAARYCLLRAAGPQQAEFPGAGRGSVLVDVERGDGRYAYAARVTPTDAYPVRVQWCGDDGARSGQVRLADEDGKRARQLVALYPDGTGVLVLVANRDGSFSCARIDDSASDTGRLAAAPVPPMPVAVEFADVVPHRSREPYDGAERDFRDVYALDAAQRLWVVRESRSAPGRWLPPVPIDREVGRIAVAGRESGERDAALFSCHRAGPLLRLHVHQARTRRWRGVEVRLPATAGEAYTADFHHVEVSVFDAIGTPLPLHEVSLASAAHAGDCEVYWRRPGVTGAEPTLHTLTARPQPFLTDHAGVLRFMVRATTLARSELVLADAAGVRVIVLRPGTKTLAYLAGTGALRESDARGRLPAFDAQGTALGGLATGVAPDRLARTAGTIGAIARHALAGPGAPSGVHAPPSTGTASVSTATVLASTGAEGEVEGDAVVPAGSVPNGEGDPLLFGDLWFGVERGAVDAGGWVADGAGWAATELALAGRAVTGTAPSGRPVAPGVRLPVRGLEESGRAVGACFAGVGVPAREAIGWLSTSTDWRAVWEAKVALQEAMRLSRKVLGTDGFARLDRAFDAWLDAREGDADRLLDALAHGLLKDKSFQTGIALVVPHPVVFEALNDPITGWLEERLQRYGPLTFPAPRLDRVVEQAFAADFAAVSDRIMGHLRALWRAVGDLVGSPRQVYGQDLAHLLAAAKESLREVMGCVREVVHSLLRVADAAMEAVVSVLNTALDTTSGAPNLTPLWQLAARAAGRDEDDLPTVGGLLALTAAYPATVAYKVATGDARASLFPGGAWPFHDADGAGGWAEGQTGGQPGGRAGDRVGGQAAREQALVLGVLTSMSTCCLAFAQPGVDLWAPRDPDQPLLRHFHAGVLASSLVVLAAGFGDWTLATVPAEHVPYQVLGEVVAGLGSLLALLGDDTPAGQALDRAAPVVTTLAAVCALPLVAQAWETGHLATGPDEWAAALGLLGPLFAFLALPEFATAGDARVQVPAAHAAIDLGAHVAAAIPQLVAALG